MKTLSMNIYYQSHIILFNKISKNQLFAERLPTKVVKVADHLVGGRRLLIAVVYFAVSLVIDSNI